MLPGEMFVEMGFHGYTTGGDKSKLAEWIVGKCWLALLLYQNRRIVQGEIATKIILIFVQLWEHDDSHMTLHVMSSCQKSHVGRISTIVKNIFLTLAFNEIVAPAEVMSYALQRSLELQTSLFWLFYHIQNNNWKQKYNSDINAKICTQSLNHDL